MGTPQETEYRKRVGYQAMLLGGFSTLATALLVAGNLATRDAILERQKEDLHHSLSQVIPSEQYDNDLLENPLQLDGPQGEPLTVYRGTEGMQISALAWEISGQGYAGEIRLILGLDADGSILGVRVLSHAETPGLGDKMEVAKDDWILDFNGLSLGQPPADQWQVKKDGGRFDQFSGATITPRAVVQAIKGGLEFFQEHRTELLNPPVITTATVVPE
ncbi:MAG: electron transport complex subunit RsxG [Candidatus Thiodiazotropha endolucinida]|nr:electron transport complex subunit RsxG [Candidatus Thiodiazotropha endolucinida]